MWTKGLTEAGQPPVTSAKRSGSLFDSSMEALGRPGPISCCAHNAADVTHRTDIKWRCGAGTGPERGY